MVILDQDRDGCTVWLINSPVTKYENKVTKVKGGDVLETCKSLINRLAVYKEVRTQWGNWVKRLCWEDNVHLDISTFGKPYRDIFAHYGLGVIDVHARSADIIMPEKIMIKD